MGAKNQQTHAKRARELALLERRERKRAKKAEAAAQRLVEKNAPDSRDPTSDGDASTE